MSRTAALKHVHRYMRTRPRNEIIWKCMLPGCSHFIPLNTTVVGRNSMCWECGEAFTIEDRHTKQEDGMPKCDPCTSGVVRDFDIDAYMKEQMERNKTRTPEPEPDQIEVIEPDHSDDCDIHFGGPCTCQ